MQKLSKIKMKLFMKGFLTSTQPFSGCSNFGRVFQVGCFTVLHISIIFTFSIIYSISQSQIDIYKEKVIFEKNISVGLINPYFPNTANLCNFSYFDPQWFSERPRKSLENNADILGERWYVFLLNPLCYQYERFCLAKISHFLYQYIE